MGFLKSIASGLLSMVIVLTLPTGIFAYFFFQEFDPSNLDDRIFTSVFSALFESEQFRPMLDEFESGLDEMLDGGLRSMCVADPDLNLTELIETFGEGMPEGPEGELAAMIFSSISCSDINATTTGADLVEIIIDSLESGEITLPASMMEGFDMGMGGGFDAIIGKLGSVTALVDRYVYYMIMVGLICSLLMLVIVRNPAEFSRKMGIVFLSQGLFMVLFVYGMQELLPTLIGMLAGSFGGGVPVDIEGMVSPIINTLILDPLKAVMWVNFVFIGAGAAAYILGRLAGKREG